MASRSKKIKLTFILNKSRSPASREPRTKSPTGGTGLSSPTPRLYSVRKREKGGSGGNKQCIRNDYSLHQSRENFKRQRSTPRGTTRRRGALRTRRGANNVEFSQPRGIGLSIDVPVGRFIQAGNELHRATEWHAIPSPLLHTTRVADSEIRLHNVVRNLALLD